MRLKKIISYRRVTHPLTRLNDRRVSLAASGFTDLRQPRISGAAVTAVPDPVSMVLFGIGLLGTATHLLKPRRQQSYISPLIQHYGA
jgi:hypothetical protein